ncbi:receptor like protein 26-like [Eucalyptus grandis]|uniref:receptor like protein 26-like n=1 Tax=Eucalyptus grandis TaxID=71139 RepID=UPI00192F0FAB|nr:receptor like protein 26-like [Eucalyptus grandis]
MAAKAKQVEQCKDQEGECEDENEEEEEDGDDNEARNYDREMGLLLFAGPKWTCTVGASLGLDAFHSVGLWHEWQRRFLEGLVTRMFTPWTQNCSPSTVKKKTMAHSHGQTASNFKRREVYAVKVFTVSSTVQSMFFNLHCEDQGVLTVTDSRHPKRREVYTVNLLTASFPKGIFPYALFRLPSLTTLYIGNNQNLSGILPKSNWTSPLEALSLWGTSFSGELPIQVFSNTSLGVIDLSNNKFRGSIPLPSPVTYYYSIASNNITGKIPSLICNATWLEIIDLSNNSLTGSLPWCLTNFGTNLSILNLRMNQLEGTIPPFFSLRSGLMTFDLSRNRFEGTLPQSLVKCRYLEVLDLSHNQIEDTFPRWLGTLPELKILVLRSNNLKGLLDIPRGAHLFPKLHILDLSNNSFSGPLPTNLMMNFKGMMNGENGHGESLYMTRSFQLATYENSVAVMMKGLEVELVRILTFLTIIDLSCNSFQGNIPEVIGHLHSLVGLNLSHNHLTGSIPPILGNLANLGWLDLSSNKLSGLISGKLGDLASLGYLNLSKNQLIGRIPQDKQLSTFSSNSFSGNPGLCGTPLPKVCPGDAQSPLPSSSSTFDRKGHESWLKKNTTWIGYASGIIIGISIAYIAFETQRPKWLTQGVRMLERGVAEWMEKPKGKAIKFH